MWWRRFDIDAVDESQILRSLVVTTCRLFIWVVFFTSSIFSSLTDIDMSLIFFVDWLWLLEEVLSREWKLCMMTFLITQRSNIVQTASNWDFLTLLTSIRTQNRIKRFVVNITYRWILLSVTCKWYEIIYFYSENSQEILRITFIKTYIQIYSNLSNQSLNQIYLFIFLTMTRDFKSVESWTAHLFRSIASRRVFIISFDVSAESQNVTISWDINTNQQLCQWAHDQSNEIIKMLIELRNQQNMTLKLNEQWIVIQVEHDKRLNQLEIKQMIINTLEETNKRY